MKRSVAFDITASKDILKVFDDSIQKLLSVLPSHIYLSSQTKIDLKTAFAEAVANAIKHGKELEYQGKVIGELFLDEKDIGFIVVDHGSGFDIERVPLPNLEDFADSGRGVFMMKQLGDEVRYFQRSDENILVFKRHLVAEAEDARELDLLYNLSEAILRHATMDEVYEIILTQALELFHVERASVLIFDEGSKKLKVVASKGLSQDVQKNLEINPGDGVSGYVFRHGRALLIEDVEQNDRGIEKKGHYKTSSFISAPMICSPLRTDERSVGVINLTDRLDGRQFTRKDLKLLSTIANQAMAFLHIRNLIDEIKKNESAKQELEAVRTIQSSYLPQNPPELKGFDVAGCCEMAQSVGGDYYDYFTKNGDVYLVIADVSGHNMQSAVTMVNFRAQLKALLNLLTDPAEILTKLNQGLCQDLSQVSQFVSCLLIKIDTNTGDYVWSNAGHYPPLFSQNSVAETESGLVFGVEESEVYKNVTGHLPPGERLVLFTDGVIESMDQKGHMFGLDRLQNQVKESSQESSGSFVNGVVATVLDHRNHNRVLDDVTVVSCVRLP